MKRQRRTTRVALSLVSTAAVVGVGATAAAQTFDVQQFHPGPSQRTAFFDMPSARILGHGVWEAGLMLDYADSPLILVPPGADSSNIVGSQLTGSLMFAIGLADRLELGVVLPLILAQTGDSLPALGDANAPDPGFGVGDIRFVPALRLFGPLDGGSGLALSVEAPIWLPSGDDSVYQGDANMRAEPRAVVEYTLGGGARLGASLGFHIRPGVEVENLEVGNTLTYGVATGIPVGGIEVIGELVGEATLGAENSVGEEFPLALNAGVRHLADSGALVQGGVGVAMNDGFGTPLYRLFFGVSFGTPVAAAPDTDPDGDGIVGDADQCPTQAEDFDDFEDVDGCPDTDNDSDGVLDRDDACPLEREDFDGVEDEDGCPDIDADRDGDRIPDAEDGCPDDAEDIDGFEDMDGCPDADNDGDGVLDVDDDCAMEPEDVDGFLDEDGCPDPDNDADGILDADDACPLEPEDYDGAEDEDGCPEEATGSVTLQCDRIEIADAVYFDTNSDVIQQRSHSLLDQIASVLRGASYVRLVSIEGHTDDRGDDAMNLDLSNRRAASVLRYLAAAGIDEARLRSVGFGEANPIAPNTTAEGQARNRRVEFRVVETVGECATPPAAAPADSAE
ncbi:MAG: OmpA family protein [Myxococcales bacterium]|nr:OmpA family protein [Myxococcales bacterium]MCB9531884.1 OmpA family protein [Myxococcales bacterium]MCB9533998.1 OmpA family protein [Myxococcales bacterium]